MYQLDTFQIDFSISDDENTNAGPEKRNHKNCPGT